MTGATGPFERLLGLDLSRNMKGFFINISLFFISAAILVLLFLPQLPVKSPSLVRFTPVRSSGPDERAEALVRQWEKLHFAAASSSISGDDHQQNLHTPAAPHIQNCERTSSIWFALDRRSKSGNTVPEWTKSKRSSQFSDAGEASHNSIEGPLPPWVKGGDEDNLPMTRQIQTDLWLHQHPRNCSGESVKFLVNDWMNTPKLGLGAQIVSMTGLLAIALNEKRILVTLSFNRADHEECKGSDRARWSCYFAPETSQECIDRATRLVSKSSAWKKGIVVNANKFQKDSMWFGQVPEYWGKPWEDMETFEVIDGKFLGKHKAADRHWWRAQAVRYFTRFQSSYMCSLMNKARHQAFGKLAAELVLQTEFQSFEEVPKSLESLWIEQRPWRPSPLVSIHVRQGDKAKEMKLFEFNSYMKLANQIQTRFPHVRDVWLSSEMEVNRFSNVQMFPVQIALCLNQNVIEESKNYTSWRFFYTDVPRQNGTTSMGEYEESLGRITSSSNAFVNLIMAADCDFFVGALGSTWSFILDGLRLTSGKLRTSFLSVNKDRYW